MDFRVLFNLIKIFYKYYIQILISQRRMSIVRQISLYFFSMYQKAIVLLINLKAILEDEYKAYNILYNVAEIITKLFIIAIYKHSMKKLI